MKSILILFLLLGGCTTTLHRELGEAAATQAVAESTTVLPDLPAECYRDVPHATRAIGQDAPVAARREYVQTDKANASKRRCVSVYTDLQQMHGTSRP